MRNVGKKVKYAQLYKAAEPFRDAKKRTISALAKVGRKHKILRYPVLLMLVAFVFVYNVLLHFFIRWKLNEKLARGLAVAMTIVLTVTSVDITAFALSEDGTDYYRTIYHME